MMQKRTALKLVLAGAAAAMLAGCGDKTEAPKEAAAPEKAAAAPADKAAGPYKVAFVYVSPASEEGWSRQHDLARIALEKVYGDKVKFTTVENIPAGADSERVLRDLAQQGNKLIFATSFGYMNSVLKVAKEFPDVKFEHATGYKTAPNVANYSARFYEARYLAGKLAGAMTKTNVLGYVAAVPIPEVLQGINAYTLGAQSVNPNVEVRVVWTSAWYDPGKESDAAKTLVGQKADVVQSWEEFYTGRINAAMDGTWKSQSIWGGIPEHMVNLVDIRSDAPQSVQDDIQAAYNKMAAREFSPFTGPIVTNEGQTVVEAGKTAPDDVLLNMNWLVKGVVGKVPTMN